jgi:predicted GIY-YIG superfamily endonuclease
VRLIGAMAYPDRSTASRAEMAFKKLSAAEKRARIWAFEDV